MIAHALVAFLLGLAPLRDGHGDPIPRRADVIEAIGGASAETEDPKRFAVYLDVTAAFETGYRDIGGGCPGTPIGVACDRARARYVSPWMLSAGRVRRGATLLDEARVAIAMMRESFVACPAQPWSFFASGDCAPHAVVDFRLRFIRAELAEPMPEIAP